MKNKFIAGSLTLFIVALLGNVADLNGQATNASVTMKVDPITGFLEIKNGLCGIIIPWRQAVSKKEYKYAPIQAIVYADGQRSDNTVNYLQAPTDPISFSAKVLTQTADEIKIILEYRFIKPKFTYPQQAVYVGGEAGPGFYKCMVSVQKNAKSIMIQEESEFDISYAFKISNGLSPDRARYRGWQSFSTKHGYESPGQLYRSENERGYPMDATVDLDYATPMAYEKLSLWDQAGAEQNSGRYWQLFNTQNKSKNLFGYFQGRPSLLVGARLSGPQLITKPKDEINNDPNCAEVFVSIARRTGDNLWFPRKRYQWGIFISTVDQVMDPKKDQPIAKEMNYRAGLGSTIQAKATKPVIINPSFYQAAIYLPASDIQQIIRRVKQEDAFYYSLMYLDGEHRGVWDAWKYQDSAKSILARLLQFRKELIDIYQSGEGTYRQSTRYWIGVRNFKITAFIISGLFADRSIIIKPQEKKELELLMGLMARIVWDEDNVPLGDDAGVNRGPANMVHQYKNNGRNFFAMLLSRDPEFAVRASTVKADVQKEINQVIFDNGSSFGSPHYTQTGLDPIWFTCLQIRQAGLGDLFTTPKIKAYSRFLMSFLTPPSSRFSGYRKLISYGDGSEESAGSFGLLATGFKPSDPTFATQLASLYYNGPANYIFAGPGPLAIPSEYQPASKTLTLTDCSYDGYTSHFRTGAHTRLESALWVLNGETFYDHRCDDRGEVVIYALGAPLSLSRSSFYMPRASSGKIRSMVVPVDVFPEWAGQNQSIESPSSWTRIKQLEFAALPHSAYTLLQAHRDDGHTWTRSILKIQVTDSFPIYVFYDSTTVESVWSMMMMSDGPVSTPHGLKTPIKRMHDNNLIKELPVGTPAQPLSAGWNTFAFTGQAWKIHAYGGIDWRLYNYTSGNNTQYSLAHWGTTWQTTKESNDYFNTNQSAYKEEQQIIRIKSKSPQLNVLVPSVKGLRHPEEQIVARPQRTTLKLGAQLVHIYPSAMHHLRSDQEQTMAWFGSRPQTLGKIRAQGGSLEIHQNKNNTITCSVHGVSGTRIIEFPYKVTAPVYQAGTILKSTGTGTTVSILYKSSGLNQELGSKGVRSFRFSLDPGLSPVP